MPGSMLGLAKRASEILSGNMKASGTSATTSGSGYSSVGRGASAPLTYSFFFRFLGSRRWLRR